ncbi:MAG TPA: aminotransferase class III-fold pyridoxal phosphate-dependent enzyme, partial [bacterium]|nr:aminotransferase class III-fold pyridoxal phosphate-dependent enzyme [bacterium]
ARKFPLIGDVRGVWLMVGIELVENRETRKPASAARERIIEESFRRGLLLLGCGEAGIRFCPPLVVTKKEVDIALDILGKSLMRSS